MPPDDVFEDLAQILGLVERCDHGVDRAGADLVASFDELGKLVHDRARLSDVRVFALDRQAIAAQQDRDAKPVAKGVEHTVAQGRQLGGDIVGNRENFLHCAQCRRSGRPRSHRAPRDEIVTLSAQTRAPRLDTLAAGRRPGAP